MLLAVLTRRVRQMVAELPGYSTPQIDEIAQLDEVAPALKERRAKVNRAA